jgi:hypothetical protein
MSTPHPHSVADLALAPVLINIERNLATLRESEDLEYDLALKLNDDGSWYHTAAERAARLQRSVTQDVDLHGWLVSPTADLHGLAVEHGGYKVSLMFGKRLADYAEQGVPAAVPAPAATAGP